MIKTCSKCHADLPLSEFSKRRAQCRPCMAARSRAWRAAHPEKKVADNASWYAANPEKQAAYSLKRKYGLTPAERGEILEQQKGLCACGCGLPATHVDHCHDCDDIDRRGSVRGLLCRICNQSLDHIARFSPTHAAYLAAHAAVCPAHMIRSAA